MPNHHIQSIPDECATRWSRLGWARSREYSNQTHPDFLWPAWDQWFPRDNHFSVGL